MNKQPIFVECRFCQKGERYGSIVDLEPMFKCPRCGKHLFLKYKLDKKCPNCLLEFDLSDIKY